MKTKKGREVRSKVQKNELKRIVDKHDETEEMYITVFIEGKHTPSQCVYPKQYEYIAHLLQPEGVLYIFRLKELEVTNE